MSYMALYRKWRPDGFQEVKGQEHIVTTLKNQIKHGKVGHAYLFCGTRGTGKTTVAKLMAKAMNCENLIDGSPCNECPSCQAISKGASMNVIEIDAASNNGVDNIRQINESVQYSPQSGKCLVYIIDEVHMLSAGAFNALLKTLEEPPSYVKFILATTESHKIPVTIMSRCQRYDFRRISIETITNRLGELLEREGVSATKEALAYVAKAADGSMRDALSILDRCISFNIGQELTYDMVLETIGAVDIEVYIKLLAAIGESDAATAVDIIDDAIWQGKDLSQLVNEFTGFIRNILMLKFNPDIAVDVTSDNVGRLIDIGESFSEGILINYINILQEASTKISYTTAKKVMLEVAIIKMSKPQMQEGEAALQKRVEDLEKSLEQAMEQLKNGAGQVVYVTKEQGLGDETLQANVSDYGEVSTDDLSSQSDQILDNLKSKYKDADMDEILAIVNSWNYIKSNAMKLTRNFMDMVSVRVSHIPSAIDLVIVKSPEHQGAIDYYDKQSNVDILKKQISDMTERDININIVKISPKEAVETQLSQWDLSKIKIKIDYKY
ncbi:MAG: DNA polymerase III subunit gamma/tau [Lachnospiraceae bacterium]|nr:DNA polymerase III subunit gamma/tau [Lachnospiraceae bacterium]